MSRTGGGRPYTSTCREIRCCCGALLARRCQGRIELKCRRCKRVLYVEISDCGNAVERAPPAAPEK
ncbi:MAG: hypothetical protein KatS3mg077_2205 [Candidatus Binatia bacterium]|nr:MAG: hypothetical protein KatS3mg077_2205 [Candidatus Binatia bacterium]